MPIQFPYFDPEGREQNKVGLAKMLDQLKQRLGGQGYSFTMAESPLPGSDFYRVFVSRGQSAGWGGQADLYLDLRMGLGSPGGQVVEMASSKPGTFGMPGFARHIAGQPRVSSTVDTMADYVQTIYTMAAKNQKTPQETAWTAYQTGSAQFSYPGAKEWGVEEFENRLYPQAGGVIGPSALSGKRSFMASTVRYYVPGGDEERRAYIEQTTKALLTPQGGPLGLQGYGFEGAKMKAWVPLTPSSVLVSDLIERGVLSKMPRMLYDNPYNLPSPDVSIFQPRTTEGT
ncbi:hypothetical protein MUP59_07385, partial [Candidatus Bathyarchaeota archaeon]|nr:hypothetical protein [Candidatus Bathyarchaeota archaeon]